MNSFKICQATEARAMRRLEPFLQDVSYKGRFIKTTKGRLAKMLQETSGDVLANVTADHVLGIELKAEREWTGNLFIEAYSNRKWGTLGWAYKIQCDFILFYFEDTDDLVTSHWPSLWRWLNEEFPNGRKRTDGMRFVKQKKHKQLNDTWGWLVPVVQVLAYLPSCRVKIQQLELFGEHREIGRALIHRAASR